MTDSQESLALQLTCGEGHLIAGDIGLVVIKALLENGISYVVTGWIDSAGANPLDAAIAGVQHTILAQQGVLLRRQRPNADHLQALLCAPARARVLGTSEEAASTARGAVVWSGRHSMRGALERFARMRVTGGVIGFCFDTDIVRSADAVVIDPSPTATGIVDAIDEAFALSYSISRPVLILLRERALGMRGTMRCRDNIAPHDARAFADSLEASSSVNQALQQIQPNVVVRSESVRTVICPIALTRCVQRSVGESATVIGALTNTLGEFECSIVNDSASVLLIEYARRSGDCIAAQISCPEFRRREVVAGSVRGEDVTQIIRDWLGVAEESTTIELPHIELDRIPARSAVLLRGLPSPIASGLIVAQAYIGVPVRLHPAFPSYRTETGTCITVVDAATFVQSGVGCAHPAAQTGVFVVFGSAQSSAAAATAASAGACVEAVDENSPRDLAEAIGRACTQPPIQPRVIVSTMSTASRAVYGEVGVESEIVGADRLSFGALPDGAVAMVRNTDPIVAVPRKAIADRAKATAGAPVAAELSPAWYDISVRRGLSPFALRVQRVTRQIFRTLIRMEM